MGIKRIIGIVLASIACLGFTIGMVCIFKLAATTWLKAILLTLSTYGVVALVMGLTTLIVWLLND